MGITMLKINPFDKIKTLDNQDMNLMEYSLGLRYFITRKLTVQGKVGIQEILMNQASSLDTIELLKDSAPKVELLVNYNLLKYKKAKLNTEAVGGKRFTGQKKIVESGTFYGLGVSFDYKIGQGLLSSGIKSIKRDLDGIYYEAEENENEISFSYQYNF